MYKIYRNLPMIFIVMLSLHASAQKENWQVLKTKNEVTDCSECGMAAVGDKLYVIGGDGNGAQPVRCLNTKSLTWTTLDTAPVVMHHFQAVAYNNKVYVLEAFSSGGFPNQEPMSSVYVFDTKTNSWQKGGEMPADRRRAGAAAALYNGKLYLVAGIQHGHSSGTTNMFDVYDPVTQTWLALPGAPHIRDHCSAAVIKDKLYVVGGRNTSFRDPDNKITFFSQTMLDIDCYDFITGKWSTLPAKLPFGTGGGAVVNLNNVLYYMGGERATAAESNAPRKDVYYLDPSTQNEWQKADTLHYARNGMAAAVVSNTIYVAGGSGGGPGGPGMMPPPQSANPGGMPPMDSNNRPSFPNHPPSGENHRMDNNKIKVEVFSLK